MIVVDRSATQDSYALFSLSVEGGEKVALTSPPADSWGDESPAFSPNGETLAFTRWTSYNIADIHLLPLTGDLEPDGDPERLAVGDQSAFDPNWTPDGKEIVYLAGRRFGAELWRVEVSGEAEPERVGAGLSPLSFALSPLGNRLAYVQGQFDLNIWRWQRSLSAGNLNPRSRFLSSTKFEHRPQYSPDGRRIAFISNRSGDRGVWLADADGANARFLGLGTGTQQDNVSWSPDGRRLAIDMLEDGNWDIYVVSPAGGNPLRLTTHPADDFAPHWSHDGSVVYFESRRGGPTDIWKVSAAGGEPVRITREGGFHPAGVTRRQVCLLRQGNRKSDDSGESSRGWRRRDGGAGTSWSNWSFRDHAQGHLFRASRLSRAIPRRSFRFGSSILRRKGGR